MQHGMMAVKAATLSDAEVRQVADQACAESDQQNRIAPANSKYGQRLDKIAKALGDQIDGVPVNYKVYLTEEVNAWAMGNGCIRVYSGLMELMSDNEIEGVLGHEMGHVALGHTRKAAQTAYAAAAVRGAAGASKKRRAGRPVRLPAGRTHRIAGQRAVLPVPGIRRRRFLLRATEEARSEHPGPGHRLREAGQAGRRRQQHVRFAPGLPGPRRSHPPAHRRGSQVTLPPRSPALAGDLLTPPACARECRSGRRAPRPRAARRRAAPAERPVPPARRADRRSTR